MKYKLINKQTNEEHLCDKVTIDGFDYYVSDEEEQVVLDKNYYEHDNHIPIYSFTKDTLPKEYYLPEVIATNNPNIDIPKVVNKVEKLAKEQWGNVHRTGILGFIDGYNKSQETHPFSEQDMLDFVLWKDENKFSVISTKEDWVSELLEYSGCVYTTKELLQLWKEQRTKIIYYE